LIGISTWLERVRWDIFDQQVAFVEAGLVAGIVEAGGDAVLLPSQPRVPTRLITSLDAVVLVGGPDIQLPRYAAVAGQVERAEVGKRDAFELALAGLALERGIPVLGICRGCQVLNATAGGSLVPEVDDRFDGVVHSLYDADSERPFEFAEHEVKAVPGTPVEAVLGSRFSVLSSHHQAVDRLAPGLLPAAHSEDGLIEAFYSPAHPFALGVQWHPEAGPSLELFRALVEAARARG